MEQGLGFKELYEVSLKATYPIEVGGKIIESGETVAAFDRIQLANFQEIKAQSKTSGGYDNRSLVVWDETKELRLSFSQGVFSKTQFALMANAQLFNKAQKETIKINKVETGETDEEGIFSLSRAPVGNIFVYDKNIGEKIPYELVNKNILKISKPFLEIVVDYQYDYNNGYVGIQVGEALTQGYLSLVGKMRVKDDITGQVTTGIINIPRLKLMSDLSMRLGADASPQVGRLDAVALPVGGKGNKKIMEIIFLEDDVDSDM